MSQASTSLRGDGQRSLEKKSVQVEIAELASRGVITTADDIVEKYGVTFTQAITLLSNPKFIALVAGISRANATLTWHSKVMPAICRMLDHPDPKIQLQAMKMLGQITDSLKGGDFNIHINLESMVKQFSDEKQGSSNNLNEVTMEAEYKRILEESD